VSDRQTDDNVAVRHFDFECIGRLGGFAGHIADIKKKPRSFGVTEAKAGKSMLASEASPI